MKTIIDFANKVRSLVDGRISNIANVEESPSTHACAVGKQLIFNGLLCKATSAIAVGDTLAVGTNLALSDNVVEQIYSLNQGLSNSLNNLAPSYSSLSTYAVDSFVTYNGKFYKCIVAVTSPEQFDINKWDDVTTSEVYLRQGDYLKRVDCDVTSCLRMSANPSDMYESVFARDGNNCLSMTYVKTRNELLMQHSADGGLTWTSNVLYPTMAVGQTLSIQIDTFATVSASDTVQIPIQSPSFFDAATNRYSVSINYCLITHKEGTIGNYQLTNPTIGLISMRKDCALVWVKSADITAESYAVNSIAQAYIDITITRNS
jgi:hypothetical protein